MKTRRILALLTALVMVLGVLPGIAFAADGDSLKLLESYIASTISTGTYAMDGFTDRPYAVSWGNADGYRMGVLAFSTEGLDKDTARATLKLKVSRTQNVNENGTSTVSVYAMDPAKVDNTNNLKPDAPTNATKVGTISMAGLPTQNTTITSNNDVSAEINLAKYFELYPDAQTIALLLTNRDDIPDSNSRGLVGFYGKNNAGNEPQLVPMVTTSANVELKAGGKTVYTAEVKGLVIGETYTPDSSIAPEYLAANGQLYVRGELPTITVKESGSVATVNYDEATVFRAIAGVGAMLPAKAYVIGSSGLEAQDMVWATEDDDTKPGKVTYKSGDISVEVEVYANEYSPDTFYCSGTSNGANFGWKTDLGYTYGGGVAIFDAVFNTGAGKNRLISYGNVTTGSFNGTGPVMRYMNAGVFEYYDGTWKQSTVACEANKTYRLRTVVDMANRTYRMYIAEGDSIAAEEITEGFASFRNQSLAYIDRVFFHGDDLEQGVNNDVITSHYEVWLEGYTALTVNYKSGSTAIAESKTTKWTTGTRYTDNDAPKTVVIDGDIYIKKDVNTVPSIMAEGDSVTLDIEYNKVTIASVEAEANTVVGQAPVIPSKAKVIFSDGQSLSFDVEWEDVDVDVTEVGTSTFSGTVAAFNVKATLTVNVKDLIPDDGSELGKVSVATNNGGWNWYVEPSGTHIEPGDALATRYQSGQYATGGYEFKHDRTYMGWVEDDGSIVVAQYDHDKDVYTRVVIHEKLESDDHNNPAVVVLPDGRIMAVYTMHTNEPYMYFRVTKNPEDISEWHAEQYYYCETKTDMETSSGYNATYPTIFLVHDDPDADGDVIYAGWRGVHWKPTLAKFPMPDENGQFFVEGGAHKPGVVEPVMGQTQFANTTYGYSTYDNNPAPNAKIDGGRTDSGRRPYTKYDYDFDENKIYITFTANHPDNDFRNHIYYLYLNIEDQNLYTAKGTYIQPLPFENQAEFASQGAGGTSGQWGVVTVDLLDEFPELLVFDATVDTNGAPFQPNQGSHAERRGWTWDIAHNEKGEPCIVYADVTATPPKNGDSLPDTYLAEVDGNTRTYHYYWYARWDSENGEWVNTFLTYAGKWFHQNATQERCYSGGLTFDHNYPGNVIYLAIPTIGEYGNVFEIYRWETDDLGTTWTKRQAITEDSPTSNARPNAIYNYKQNEDGSNAGPRLLWISGEYRYWMNYEYKTGVKTDFPGMITQDDPEMFADAALTVDGEEIDKLPVGNATVNAEFVISNISIGDGAAKVALAHYDKNNKLVKVITSDLDIPARSVPQTSVLGADKDTRRANGLSAMGTPEIVENIPYTADFAEGDKIKLFAWNMGIEHPMSSIIGIPYEMSTSGSRYILSEDFTYQSDDKLVLNANGEGQFGDWIAKAYSGNYDYNNDWNYVAVTKAAFGNTGLHIYRHGDGGLMVSHALPDTNGRDYTLEFTMRHIDEWSWNNTDNQGFTLSHGVPTGTNDSTNSHSAFQYRYGSAWRDENGRGTSGRVRNSLAFDGGSQSEIFHNVDLYRSMEGNVREDYSKGVGYYDPQQEIYIHDYNDALYTGALFQVKVDVHPQTQIIDLSIFDGYRMATYTTPYVSGYDWVNNPIDTITFSIGNEKWGEIYIDNFRMYYSSDESELRNVTVTPVDGAAMAIGSSTWNMLPSGDAYVFFDPADSPKVMEVYGQSRDIGATVGTWEYNGGENQKFYLEDAGDGYYYIRGKQSGLYLGVSATGAVTLQEKANATVFAIKDTDDQPSAAFVQMIEMIKDGTYIPTMEAIAEE